jgi:hypothetical protein
MKLRTDYGANFDYIKRYNMKTINLLIPIGFLIGTQQAYLTDKYNEPELSWGVDLGIISEDGAHTELASDRLMFVYLSLITVNFI